MVAIRIIANLDFTYNMYIEQVTPIELRVEVFITMVTTYIIIMKVLSLTLDIQPAILVVLLCAVSRSVVSNMADRDTDFL